METNLPALYTRSRVAAAQDAEGSTRGNPEKDRQEVLDDRVRHHAAVEVVMAPARGEAMSKPLQACACPLTGGPDALAGAAKEMY